ncbi:MAG: HD domain-containing protein [Chitinispirillales bacterium]|jgi:poly(A) polymerase|nr:HD domain-containing protein [Chitinispirillales bacterium]
MFLDCEEAIAKLIVIKLQNLGYEAYYAGGFVRDMLLGFPAGNSPDIDIATSARPEEIVELFNNTKEVGISFGVVLVIERGIAFDVATFRNDGQYVNGRCPQSVSFSSAQEDAHRRDFTINGMFYNPVDKTVIDFVGGQDDLNKGIIRTIGNAKKRFSEDYLRMLRAVRFSSRFDFEIEVDTFNAVKCLSKNIAKISAERIYKELTLSFCSAPAKTMDILDKTGLLDVLLPEISVLHGVEQPPEFHPEGDCYIHTLKSMKYIEDLVKKFICNKDSLREDQKNVLSDSYKRAVLVWSVLLHDIGKPATMTIEDRIRFNRHDEKSAEMAQIVAKRFKMPSAETKDVVSCVANHMKFMFVQKMKSGKLKTFISRKTMDIEIILHEADCFSSHGMMDNAEFLLKKIDEIPPEEIKPKPIVCGNDLLDMGFVQGIKLGDVLKDIYEKQLDNYFQSREDALIYAQKQLSV